MAKATKTEPKKLDLPAGAEIEITSKRAGYRRAGVGHPKGAMRYAADKFSEEQLRAFEADPHLKVRIVPAEPKDKKSSPRTANDD